MMKNGKLERIRVLRTERMLTVLGVPNVPGTAAEIFSALADARIPITMIVQNAPDTGSAGITFTIRHEDADKALAITRDIATRLGAEGLMDDSEIARVTVGGSVMENVVGIAGGFFTVLADGGINVLAINTTADQVSCIIEDKASKQAVDLLCEKYGLSVESVTD